MVTLILRSGIKSPHARYVVQLSMYGEHFTLNKFPFSHQRLIDFQPDQGVASALWLSAISVLLFRDIQVKAQVVSCGLVRLKIADVFP
ncbi:hypothetical protein HVY60_14475 [Citrobacter freundii]|nr:hypothetical protein [Citrobacter freundii]QMG41704.1 hypothetical protein HVY60_14475 [Citrobacter freundii]